MSASTEYDTFSPMSTNLLCFSDDVVHVNACTIKTAIDPQIVGRKFNNQKYNVYTNISKLFLTCNNTPTGLDNDAGIETRILITSFDHKHTELNFCDRMHLSDLRDESSEVLVIQIKSKNFPTNANFLEYEYGLNPLVYQFANIFFYYTLDLPINKKQSLSIRRKRRLFLIQFDDFHRFMNYYTREHVDGGMSEMELSGFVNQYFTYAYANNTVNTAKRNQLENRLRTELTTLPTKNNEIRYTTTFRPIEAVRKSLKLK